MFSNNTIFVQLTAIMAENVPYDIYNESPNNSLLRQTGDEISDVFPHLTAALYPIITLKICDTTVRFTMMQLKGILFYLMIISLST